MTRWMLLVALWCGLWGCAVAPVDGERADGNAAATVERWGVFELTLHGPAESSGVNPFVDVRVGARFSHDGRSTEVAGFYDGDGVYRVRFMPSEEGAWRYESTSNRAELAGRTGAFTCEKPVASNHGPVEVRHTFHFGYADGAAYFELGTTCYGWAQQARAVEEQTLATLKGAPFNKMRMCVLPKEFNFGETVIYPFAGAPPKAKGEAAAWDFTRLNPAYFQHLEARVRDLRDLGIEADLILFHPYESTLGFDKMPAEVDDRYLRYVVARLGAYRNVWWSMANEFDQMAAKTDRDWDGFFQVVAASDPYGHLRSIHNWRRIYNQNQPWVTHASVQNGSAVEDFGRAVLYRDVFNKPVVLDEVRYEGRIAERWGNLTGEQMVEAFWQGTIAGTYVGHSETFSTKGVGPATSWLAQGGVLEGMSPPRLAFLKQVMAGAPDGEIDPIDKWWDAHTAGKAGAFYLVYFGRETPAEWVFELPKSELKAGMTFHVDVLDTWNMTVSPVAGTFRILEDGKYRYHAELAGDGGPGKVTLPGRPYMAVRVTVVR